MRHNVAVLALESVLTFDLGVPARVLSEARSSEGEHLYDVTTVTLGTRPVRTQEGPLLETERGEEILTIADTVVIPTQEPSGRLLHEGLLDTELANALTSIRPETRVVSMCTSAFILAAAGLLDGRKATTHWAYASTFRRLFPQVELDPEVLFVDEGRILTGAGAAAGIDLFLHLIRRDHGTAVANSAARQCVTAPWREGGQAQFLELPTPPDRGESTTRTRHWAVENLTSRLTLRDLAEHARMSERTFTRRFLAETGTSAGKWLTRERLERARALLETTDAPIEEVAKLAGFSNAVALRRHFSDVFGVSPNAYRRTFSYDGN